MSIRSLFSRKTNPRLQYTSGSPRNALKSFQSPYNKKCKECGKIVSVVTDQPVKENISCPFCKHNIVIDNKDFEGEDVPEKYKRNGTVIP